MYTRWMCSLVVLLGFGHLVTLSPCRLVTARAGDLIDSPMYTTPPLPGPRVILVFPEEARQMWLKALERPEAEMRCRAAEAIAQAKRRGFKGLESTAGPLRAALDKPDQHPTARLAVAQALIALEAKESAPNLFRQAQAGD